MDKKTLIIGFGSIGKKHDENLLLSVSPAFKNVGIIYVVKYLQLITFQN